MSDGTTSQVTQAGLTIPDDVAKKFADLIALIKASESMNNEERQYWVNILPIMTQDQIQNLQGILANERDQLQAIDKKYAQEIEKIGQPADTGLSEEEQTERRDARRAQEKENRQQEEEHADKLLGQIEEI
jgi:biopolymer transport protein ExbB/TolQ